MAKKAETIVSEIRKFIAEEGETNYGWYVGIAANARSRLFDDHGVPENNGGWIYRRATSHKEARRAEKALLADGHKGGTGGGDEDTDYVYAYMIRLNTTE